MHTLQPSKPIRSRTAGPRRAFTLIELVIVVLITSIFAAAAVPKFYDSLMFHRVETAARRVKSDLELARSSARLTSAPRTVAFSGLTYNIADVAHLDKPDSAYQVDLASAPYELSSLTADFDDDTFVSFDGFGTPSSGGTVTLAAGDCRCTVALDAATGHVTIESQHTRSRTARVTSSNL